MKRAILFCLLSIFVSGCAGSGGVSQVRPFNPAPAPSPVPAPEPRPYFVFEPPAIGEYSSGVVKGMSYYKYTPPPPETGRQDEEEEVNPYLLPAVAVPDPDSDASLSDLPPARAFDRSWLVTPVSPCEDFFHNYRAGNIVRSEFETVTNIGINFLPSYTGTRTPSAEPSHYGCTRARVPGLTPLYKMVLKDVSARVDAGENLQKIGVVIDKQDHGLQVLDVVEMATPRELFHYAAFSGFGTDITAIVREPELSLNNEYTDEFNTLIGGVSVWNPTEVDLVSNPIFNISYANQFKTIDVNNPNDLDANDILRGGGLLSREPETGEGGGLGRLTSRRIMLTGCCRFTK